MPNGQSEHMATIPIERPKTFAPDFCRRQWVSREARALWAPRLAAIARQWSAAELASVENGMRFAAVQSIAPEQFPELSQRAASRGLAAIGLEVQARANDYAAGPVSPDGSGRWDYRIAVMLPLRAIQFIEAWRDSDDETIGRLLGYPECCRRFFAETWGAGSVDPTWEMAEHGDGPIEANILLRWLGVRYVPHLPCGFRCEETARLARRFRKLIPLPERLWMDQLLAMPMLWTALHGIGELVTPIVTLNFRSEISHELREIRREGGAYPELGARGIRFPYRRDVERPDSRLWTDNGFDSLEAMEKAHGVILSLLEPEPRKVLDLGCGNGLLARRLAGPHGRAIGVERDCGRASRAAARLNEVRCADLVEMELGSFHPDPDVVLLMPGRLIERPQNGFVKTLRESGVECLVYAYGDWLTRYGSLDKVCLAAGMEGSLARQVSGPGVAAGVWSWPA